MKFIYSKGADIPKEYKPKKKIPLEVRVVPDLHMALKYNQTIAGIVLPDMSGKVDFGAALMGEDPQFLKWVELLFDYYWEKGEPAF